MDDAIADATTAVGLVLSAARLEMISIAGGAGTAADKLDQITALCKRIVPFVARPFEVAATTNTTDIPLWPKHSSPAVNLEVLRATFSSGSSQHESIRLVVRQALAWDFNRNIDPSELLG